MASRGKGLSVASVVIGVLVSSLVAVSSVYIAFMLSALPWPIIIAVITSFALYKLRDKLFGRTSSIHELNVAQAAGSIGGLVGAALVFTIPALIFLGKPLSALPSPFTVWLVAMFGGLLGVSFSIHVKRVTVDEENLAFPSGTAGAEVLIALEEKGSKAKILFEYLLLAFIINAVLLFWIGFPVISGFVAIGGVVLFVGIYLSLAAVGVGYLIRVRSSFSWLVGAIIGWLILVPYFELYEGLAPNGAIYYVQRLGIGIVFGFGLAFFLSYLFKGTTSGRVVSFEKREDWVMLLVSALAFLALYAVGINPLGALIAIVGAWVMSFIAGKTTGETDIDPLEQFGLFIGLLVMGLYAFLRMGFSIVEIVLIITFVSAAASLAGDIGHDFKSAKIIGTRDTDIFWGDMIAVVFGSGVATLAMFVVLRSFYSIIVNVSSVAFQSKLVATVLSSTQQPITFYLGLLLGLILGFLAEVERFRKYATLAIPFGIGLFLGLSLAIPIVVGGLLAMITKNKRDIGIIIASGLLAGEGLSGFVVGIIKILFA